MGLYAILGNARNFNRTFTSPNYIFIYILFNGSYYFATLKTTTWFYGFYLCCSVYFFFDLLIFQPSVTLLLDFIIPSISSFPVQKVIEDISGMLVARGLMQPLKGDKPSPLNDGDNSNSYENSSVDNMDTTLPASIAVVKAKYKEVVKGMQIPSFKKKTTVQPSSVVPVTIDAEVVPHAAPTAAAADRVLVAAPLPASTAATSDTAGVFIRKNLLSGLSEDPYEEDDDEGIVEDDDSIALKKAFDKMWNDEEAIKECLKRVLDSHIIDSTHEMSFPHFFFPSNIASRLTTVSNTFETSFIVAYQRAWSFSFFPSYIANISNLFTLYFVYGCGIMTLSIEMKSCLFLVLFEGLCGAVTFIVYIGR